MNIYTLIFPRCLIVLRMSFVELLIGFHVSFLQFQPGGSDIRFTLKNDLITEYDSPLTLAQLCGPSDPSRSPFEGLRGARARVFLAIIWH